MTPAALPSDEAARLLCLGELELGQAADPVLDGLVRCAAQLLDYPIALVSLVDAQRQWFLARQGLAITETPRELAFCAHAILGDGLFEVTDAQADARFADNPLVTGAPFVRAYAGMPIALDGHRLGTLCLIDHQPRKLDARQTALLADLAAAVAAWFASRREHLQLLAERTSAQARLALLSGLTEQVPGVLFEYRVAADGSTGFTYASGRTRELFGLDPDALHGDLRVFLDRAHPEDRAALRNALQQATASFAPWQCQFRVQLPTPATPAWRMARASPTRQPDGSVLWHGFIADSTEQAEMEQLRRDKLAAEHASTEKTRFLSRVSHELRTPLNAVIGFTQLLQIDTEEPLTTRQRERADQANRSARLLLDLINDVLDLSRIEQGARPLTLEPVDAVAMARLCIETAAQLGRERAVSVQLLLPAKRPLLVRADRRALEQVLLNLLSNGVKYNRRGGQLRLSIEAADGQVQIAIADEGAGLDAAQMAALFQPFNRLGAEQTRIEGSGLGLVIARQLAEAMGGGIAVQSLPGAGSTFTLTLDACAPTASMAASADSTDSPRPEMAAHDNGICVLYIEDEPVNALLVQEALRCRPAWRLVHAADGPSGLALAQALRPQVVLSDINLPGLSGLDIVRALRRDEHIGHVVCIALSADAMDAQVEEAMQAGFDDYWTKPLDVASLARRIDGWLDRGDRRLASLPKETS